MSRSFLDVPVSCHRGLLFEICVCRLRVDEEACTQLLGVAGHTFAKDNGPFQVDGSPGTASCRYESRRFRGRGVTSNTHVRAYVEFFVLVLG